MDAIRAVPPVLAIGASPDEPNLGRIVHVSEHVGRKSLFGFSAVRGKFFATAFAGLTAG
jgi:hypothetical protein